MISSTPAGKFLNQFYGIKTFASFLESNKFCCLLFLKAYFAEIFRNARKSFTPISLFFCSALRNETFADTLFVHMSI